MTHLAVEGRFVHTEPTKSALLFLYREVLGSELSWLDDVEPTKRPQRLPTVLDVMELRAVLDAISGLNGLIARLLYGICG